MFQLDNSFLEEVGLGSLPDNQKQEFLATFREQLELRVGTRLSEGLSDEQLDEFGSFMDRDEQKVTQWLSRYSPDYVNDQVYQRLQQGAPASVAPIAVLAEYASLKWLSLNRPDYRQVVQDTIAALKKEIIENRDAILGVA
ncbi:MAG: DUF5663 domain-containing protein [Candidatus Saccharimonas sp.]